MPSNKQAHLVVTLGDLHAGGTTSICPGTRYYKQGTSQAEKALAYNPTRMQTELFEDYMTCIRWVKSTLKKRQLRLFLILMGDLVEGVQHHNSRETWGNEESQHDLAVELCMPLVNIADGMAAVWGTPSHVGEEGRGDVGVYRDIGCYDYDQTKLIEINGRIINASHHASTGRKEQLIDGGLKRLLEHEHGKWARQQRQSKELVPVADIYLRAHVHFLLWYPWPDKNMAGAFTGSWQLPTHYVGSKHYRNHHIGMLMFQPMTNAPDWYATKEFYPKPEKIRVAK